MDEEAKGGERMTLTEFDFLDWAHKQPEFQILRERFKELLTKQREECVNCSGEGTIQKDECTECEEE